MLDPYFSSVVLLIGNDNAADTSTTFTDQSNSSHTATVNGNIQYDTAQAPTGMSSSILGDGTGDYLSYASHADFGLGTGDYTFELMVRFATDQHVDFIDMRTAEPSVKAALYAFTGAELSMWINGANVIVNTGIYSTNTWYHYAYSRSGSTNRMFLNGTQIGSNATNSSDLGAAAPLTIGGAWNGSTSINGWISNIRITKGVARYTSNFTVDPLPWPTGGPLQRSRAPIIQTDDNGIDFKNLLDIRGWW